MSDALVLALVALAGLLAHDYLAYRVARYQAAETARMVRAAIFGPDPPREPDAEVMRAALEDRIDRFNVGEVETIGGVEQPETDSPVMPDLEMTPPETPLARGREPSPRSLPRADVPTGSARARLRRADEDD